MSSAVLVHRALATAAARAGLAASLAAALTACGGGGTVLTDTRATADPAGGWSWNLPNHYPEPLVPSANPMSFTKVELGRFLFYDPRLSGNGRQACASCHQQSKAFTDGRLQALGSTGELHPRNAQHLSNVVFNATFTWANPSLVTLERQMETPLFGESPVEMGVNDGNKALVLQRLRDDKAASDYPRRFAAAFPDETDAVTWNNVIKAIAAFQRSMVSANSRYDRWLVGQEKLTDAETRGMNLFFGEKAECFHCHGSFNFNDQIVHARTRLAETPFHNTGLYNVGGTGAFPEPNRGIFELTARANDMGKFRAPSLRNVEVTAPYMHDGSMASLEEVLSFYAAGGRVITSGPLAGDGRTNPYKSDLITRIDLSAQEQADLIAFLKTLTDHDFLTTVRLADPFTPR